MKATPQNILRLYYAFPLRWVPDNRPQPDTSCREGHAVNKKGAA